jgi:septum formation protein
MTLQPRQRRKENRMIILASESPRRAELLAQVGIEFRAEPAHVDEAVHDDERAADYVERMAVNKARGVHQAFPSYLVLGADTAVVLDQTILGKPADRDDAIRMLLSLSRRTHQVLTGVAIVTDQVHYRLSLSQVSFREISEREAEAYWATGEPADKAGGYAIQGLAAAFIERIEGSYSGIMGLPLFETMQLLNAVGVHGQGGV